MDITWIKNSTFLIKTSMGKRLLIDPFNKIHTCDISSLNPNIITLSSQNIESLCPNEIGPHIKIINSPGTYDTDIGLIKGYTTYCDHYSGYKRGPNTIYTYNIDNLKLCHLGYLGEFLSDNIIDELDDIDILFIPIGGHINLSGKEAYMLIKKISPKVIIPMNYKYSYSSFLFNGLKDFTLLLKKISKINTESFTISKETLMENENAIILPPMFKSPY
ncbi:MBL fold metallo-hydrolase [Clostridium sardiniense]|uniref:MBL fold metallo-hydrolase n=1 Tax=Clostridium sardiniense TaxID=29369 RepID=UPI00195F0F12|nr:MBL fold metallo-hydrolase [Clostridium sardiniense]MBM7836556.1 L-ascorbate metabolism protein UlaG (beta-lactamase superfamily) [Clostridium sardiniense]